MPNTTQEKPTIPGPDTVETPFQVLITASRALLNRGESVRAAEMQDRVYEDPERALEIMQEYVRFR